MNALKDLWRRNSAACAALLIAAVVLVRIAVVVATPLEIGPDEAQYWRWSQNLDFGYYSKPPLIAWVIAASTAVFGDGEWAIRFFSPVLHGVAAYFLFLLGQKAFDARIGAWAAAIYLLMPGIWLSSTIMSTDAVLLPAWAAALYFLWRFRDSPNMTNAALAGAAIGLAMLGKYAALYLYAGAGLAALIDKDMRKAVLSPAGGVLVLASLVVVSPNIYWNFANNFATVSHTADNANLGEAGFSPLHVFGFLGDQAAVFGPVTLLLLLGGFGLIIGRKDKVTATRELWLLCFILPPLLIVTMGQEIMSRAHANWAATAYPAACILLASWIDRAFGSEASRIKVGPFPQRRPRAQFPRRRHFHGVLDLARAGRCRWRLKQHERRTWVEGDGCRVGRQGEGNWRHLNSGGRPRAVARHGLLWPKHRHRSRPHLAARRSSS
jgi:hypothetical protein